ncbi:hypothetical protein C4Q31_07620 [Leptospira borgpetersenii serovar Ceylonica]|uniref:Uncharacterized protein n=1 Tax=Leptospira borgpetersenii serovar Ballum TaxID=280505 RepID=A0A0E3B2Y4_LEPBO|nr:hypothetical protein LBBP_00595 [Leptospira borgpetersenii serovar Ballum]AXX15429.1 hypothetical protein C4Q31_07620 [Leptospira borgpetersenii serovar Ceylonica]EKR02161.1 hypothetical protein LEP1GSC121_0885 [Leptospira borgpetersenii serovar Castellonis str. 200801910]EMO09402.1 hypothetical protein LEP1GSC137_2065 [Leptospira borgpetersenii str. Noumea 25]QHE25999.1 hypothetical protein GS524_02600 [Leptospira borgpetersenii]
MSEHLKKCAFLILTISTQLMRCSVDREGNESLSLLLALGKLNVSLLLALDGLLLDFYHSFDSSS